MLAHSTDLARAVLAGSIVLDAAYDEAKKAKQPLNAKVAAKTRRAANTRRRMTMSQPESATALAEFKVACDHWLPLLNERDQDQASTHANSMFEQLRNILAELVDEPWLLLPSNTESHAIVE